MWPLERLSKNRAILLSAGAGAITLDAEPGWLTSPFRSHLDCWTGTWGKTVSTWQKGTENVKEARSRPGKNKQNRKKKGVRGRKLV